LPDDENDEGNNVVDELEARPRKRGERERVAATFLMQRWDPTTANPRLGQSYPRTNGRSPTLVWPRPAQIAGSALDSTAGRCVVLCGYGASTGVPRTGNRCGRTMWANLPAASPDAPFGKLDVRRGVPGLTVIGFGRVSGREKPERKPRRRSRPRAGRAAHNLPHS
jgi:hypothetical protein